MIVQNLTDLVVRQLELKAVRKRILSRAAYDTTWRHVGARERGALLGECSRLLRAHADEILTVESEMVPVERVRTSKRSFERMVDYASQRHESGADGWVVQHISAPDQAKALVDRWLERELARKYAFDWRDEPLLRVSALSKFYGSRVGCENAAAVGGHRHWRVAEQPVRFYCL